MGSFNKLKQILEEKKRFALVCHVDPDGDAIGALSALSASLEDRGKEPFPVCFDPVPPIFQFLLSGKTISRSLPEKFDALILLDNGDRRRTGFPDEIPEIKRNLPVINIDHHPKNDLWRMAIINYTDSSASSTCELLYRIFTGLQWEITPDIATSLLAGIFYDTGGFRHSNTSRIVLDTVADLLKKGARLKKITEKLENDRPFSLLKLWGIALDRLKFNEEFGISVSVLTRSDIEGVRAREEEISGLVNLLNSASESRASLLLYESERGKIKGSLRTDRDDIDLAQLAGVLGGGGHKKAAGFTLEGKIEIKGREWRVV